MNILEKEIYKLKEERKNLLERMSILGIVFFELIFKKISAVYFNLFETVELLENRNHELLQKIERLENEKKTFSICPIFLGGCYNDITLPTWYQSSDLEKLGSDFNNYVIEARKYTTIRKNNIKSNMKKPISRKSNAIRKIANEYGLEIQDLSK